MLRTLRAEQELTDWAQPLALIEPFGGLARAAGVPITINALPQEVNLNLYRGDDFFLDLTVTDEDMQPVDLSPFQVRAEVRLRHPPETNPVLAAFLADIDDNIVHLHLTHLESEKVDERGVWDCRLYNGLVTTLCYGRITMTDFVTMIP